MPLEFVEIPSKYSKLRDTDRDRLKLALRKTFRGNGAKNHSVNKEKSFVARKQARIAKLTQAKATKQRTVKSRLLKAYWRGELDEYPK